ncbi:MAG: hypothetical protein R6V56_04945 [Lentisphaeria bacterium]
MYLILIFFSGFVGLVYEVLWTRMFAQVLENSVYTFAAILVIALGCLAAGAFISSQLSRLQIAPLHCLALLLLLSGLAVAATPFIFMQLTNSLQILAMRGSWPRYILMIFKNGFLTIGPPALLLGPVIEYMAPRNYRRETGDPIPWFIGPRTAEMVEAVLERCPPEDDKLLINRTPANRRLPLAGATYYRARLWQMMGNERKCARAWQRFVALWLWEQ